MKAYISKYALTADVYEVEGRLDGLVFRYQRKGIEAALLWCVEVHATKEQAVSMADRRRDDRIKSLEKQIHKLKMLEFK
ncbi:MAG TPA: hypothetical protein VGN00_14185 [Puia sp.]|jgi:hypothetical protein